MSVGGGYPTGPVQPGAMLASESDREGTQALLKKAFEDQRLTQDEFESRVGSALAARTQGELAVLTRDLPLPGLGGAGMMGGSSLPVPVRSGTGIGTHRPRWGLIAAIAGAIVLVLITAGVLGTVSTTSGSSGSSGSSRVVAPLPAPKVQQYSPGPAHCPIGTPKTALSIANALARDPVYTEPGSKVSAAQARKLRAKISHADPGRIRMAAVKPSTLRRGGGERTLTNAIASCSATTAGVTLVTTTSATYLVTSYPGDQAVETAVGAALNTHTSLAAGLLDAVGLLAALDPGNL
jgi:hypothetical protein